MEHKNVRLMKQRLGFSTKNLWGNVGQKAQNLSYTG